MTTNNEDKLRYDATVLARKIARDNFTKKSVAEERVKHFVELVRDPQFIKYMESLQANAPLVQQSKAEEMNDKVYAPVDYDNDFIPYSMGKYIDVNGLEHEVLNHILHSTTPLMLIGEKGNGKTHLATHLARTLYDEGILGAFVPIQGGYNVGDKQIIGYNRLNGLSGETVKGWAVKVIEAANHHAKSGKIVIGFFDELANSNPESTLVLASLLDGRRMIQTQDGKVWKLEPNAKLAIIATGNPSHYAGVNRLQEALLSRFTGFYVKNPSDKELEAVVDWTDVPDHIKNSLIQLTGDIIALRNKQDVEYSISPRDLVQFADEYRNRINNYEPKQESDDALKGCLEKIILFKFQDQTERELIKRSIEDTFGITMVKKF